MKSAEIGKVIDQYVALLKNDQYFKAEKVSKLITDADAIKESLMKVPVTEEVQHIYDALCKKGLSIIEHIKINKQDPKGNLSKAKMYLRYLKAADGDFKGTSAKAIQTYFKYFMGTSILFLALSPMYFGFVLPALLFVPIFLGIRGLKSRSYNGLVLSSMVLPVALMTSFIWVRYGFSVFADVDGAIASFMASTGYSQTVSSLFTVLPPIAGVALFVFAVMMIISGLKAKDYFI